MMKYFRLSFFFLSFFVSHNLSAQCPGCVIDLPAGLGEDTIYLSNVPDGEVGQYYDQDMSFRLPKTTTPVSATDPDVPPGFDITEITITSIANIPPGLNGTPSQTEFVTADETDGCIRLCGTPLVADTFEIVVNIEAVVFGFSQNTSFIVVMVVNPAMSSSEGFTMSNNIGCGPTTVSFTNNIPSNGNPGITYNWDFGNGNTSMAENPEDQTYTDPGEYIVSYEATIDTTGYFLQGITVVDSDCDDILNTPPDMHIRVKNPDGTELYDSPIFNNTWPPISVNVFFPLIDGNYLLEVIDDDLAGDDICGTVSFDKNSGGEITINGFTVNIDILHPVTVIASTDTVTIYEEPDAPIISAALGGEFIFCQGTSLVINSSYPENNQWYLDGELIAGATENSFTVNAPGWYSVEYTNADGCVAYSDEVELMMIPAPGIPAFVNDDNLLSVFDVADLPLQYTLQWYQNGVLLEGETGLSYCITTFDTYTLEVVDSETGCSRSFTQTVPFNANGNCTTAAEEPLRTFDIKLSPNPTTGLMNLTMSPPESGQLNIRIQDLQGRIIFQESDVFSIGDYHRLIDITAAASGLYFVQLQIGAETWVERVVLR